MPRLTSPPLPGSRLPPRVIDRFLQYAVSMDCPKDAPLPHIFFGMPVDPVHFPQDHILSLSEMPPDRHPFRKFVRLKSPFFIPCNNLCIHSVFTAFSPKNICFYCTTFSLVIQEFFNPLCDCLCHFLLILLGN